MIFTRSEIEHYYTSRVPDLKLTGTKEWRAKCPVHSGDNLNFSINAETGLAICHSACGRGWDILALEQELTGAEFGKAKEAVYDLLGRPKIPYEERSFVATYDYTDADGRLLYQVIRKVGKEFAQRRPAPGGGWTWGLGETKRVPYRLPKVIPAPLVFIVEGEKDVHTMESLGFVATCNNGGAGNFRDDLAVWFKGKHIRILPDNDDKGRDHAMKVAALLAPVAATVRIVVLPGLPAKGDVSDFVQRGGTAEQIKERCKSAQQWTPEFQFVEEVPSDNAKYVRTFAEEVKACGGIQSFWNLAHLSGLETPWKRLSRAMGGGMRAGEFYVLGANQGAGKTSLALQFITHALRKRNGVLLFSMEMGHRSVFQRMAAIEACVNLNELRDAQIILKDKNADEKEREAALATVGDIERRLRPPTEEFMGLPLLVTTKPSITPELIIEETTRLKKREKLSFVVVDHMQLMSTTGSVRSDYEKFTAISRAMKQVAVEINIPVLIVSQTSRNNSKEHRGELEVSDLRGSGAIEEDAAGVFLLYEDAEDRQVKLADGSYPVGPVKSWLKLGKSRYGEQGKYMELQHYKTFTRFICPAEEPML